MMTNNPFTAFENGFKLGILAGFIVGAIVSAVIFSFFVYFYENEPGAEDMMMLEL